MRSNVVPQFDNNELLAALLVFRLIYYILPFCIALCVMGARELWFNLANNAKSN